MCGTREPLQGLTSSKIRMPLSAKSKEVSVHKPRERSEGVGVGGGHTIFTYPRLYVHHANAAPRHDCDAVQGLSRSSPAMERRWRLLPLIQVYSRWGHKENIYTSPPSQTLDAVACCSRFLLTHAPPMTSSVPDRRCTRHQYLEWRT